MMKQLFGIFTIAILMANCSNAGTKDGKSDSTKSDTATHTTAVPAETQSITSDTLKQGKSDTAQKANKGNTNMGRGTSTNGGG